MYPTSRTVGRPIAAASLAVVLLLGVAGCSGGDADFAPAFQAAGIADKTYVQNLPAAGETLPAAVGGDGMLTYSVSPPLPAGLTFDPATRLLSGTPAVPHPATLHTYTATDSDTRGPDSASLTFTITVEADLVPTFQAAGIADKAYVQNLPAGSETLPAAAGGDGMLTYSVSPPLPAGLAFDPATRLLSGTPAAPQGATLYTYTATDSDQAGPDSASLTFTITVMQDLAPAFEQAGIADRTYTRGQAIDSETLPAAAGGDGMLTYSISPPLPAGLTFDPATRLLSGTPVAPQGATLYTYTATDSDQAGPDSASLTFTVWVQAIAAATLSAGAGEVDEGDDRTPVVVAVSLSEPVLHDVAVALAVTGTARLGSDFDLAAGNFIVPAGATSALTAVTPIRDLQAEGDETIGLEIGGVAGPAEIGAPAAVEIVIRDLGAPPPDDYAALDVFTFLGGGEPYNIGADELYLSYLVRNTGRVAASATQAVLFTTTDLFSDTDPLRRLLERPVPALGPNDSRFYDTVRVPFDELVPGVTNYLMIYVFPVAEEDPEVAGSAYGFDAVHLTPDGRIPVTCAGFERTAEPGAADPLFAHQWALDNTGQKAFAEEAGVAGEDLNMGQALFGGPTGAGVQVAVVDTGLEICHPDLAPNVEPGLSHNFNAAIWLGADGDDPFLPTVLGDHGTSVAGLIAAAAGNGIGGRGVAPRARLRGINFLEGQYQPGALFDSLGMSDESPRSSDVHVFNMSFGVIGGAADATADERELYRAGVYDLRDGLGAIYVKAAGNSFDDCTKEDDDGQLLAPRLDLSAELGCFTASNAENNLPYLIVAGAFSADGRRSSYSSAGAALWVAAPAGEFGAERPAMITTDQMGGDRGYSLIPRGIPVGSEGNPQGDYTSIFNGTSAAAPNTSGAVALLLDTQPELTWRDVKYILARTARRLDADIPRVRVAFGGVPAVLQHGWITNAAGFHFHNWYGFGAVDVDAAVALAASHAPDSLGVFIESAPVRLATGVTIPDHHGGGLTQIQNVTGLSRSANIEAVQLRIEVTHANPWDLGFELVSPAGTRSIVHPVFNHALYGADNPLDWTVLTNAFYGEPPTGQWTLNVIDAAQGNIGTLDAWSLIFYLGEHPEDR